MSQTVHFALCLVWKHTSTRPRICVITKQNCLLVMLGPISLYLGTRFLGGLRKLLDFAVLILRCSRHTALGQHLFPKQMKDVPVHVIMAKAGWKSAETFRKYYNKPVLQGNRLASVILDHGHWHLWCVFWNIAVALSLILFLLDNILKHGYHCLCSTYYFGVDLMPLVRVHFVWVHQRFKVSWDLCLLVMW